MKILILNGPNLNLLGLREPDIYGTESYQALLDSIDETCRQAEIEYEVFQSNHEGALVDKIQQAYGNFDGIVINPAAYTHTSVAILDALKAVGLPTVEVHLSDVNSRESFMCKNDSRKRLCRILGSSPLFKGTGKEEPA